MKRILILILTLPTLSLLSGAAQPDQSATEHRRERRSAAKLTEKEQVFKKMLENSELKGFWQMTGPEGLEGKAPLSEPKPEHYTVAGVSKGSGDYWIVNARVQYADKDVTIPITVRVVWADDTPIITLDKMVLPGLGTYSARVMIYRNFYSGTWFGASYGGVLAGQIVKPAATTQTSQPSGE